MRKSLHLIAIITTVSLSTVKAQFAKDFSNMSHIKEGWEGRGSCDTLYYRDAVESSLIDKTISFVKAAKTFPLSVEYLGKLKAPLQLTIVEKQYLVRELQKLKKAKWPAGMFPHSKVLNSKAEADAILRRTNLLPRKKALMCSIVYTFSKPIYLRNNTIAFYLEQEQYTMSETQLSFDFYRKEHGEWDIYAEGYIDMGDMEDEEKQPVEQSLVSNPVTKPSLISAEIATPEDLTAFGKQVIAAFKSREISAFVNLFPTLEQRIAIAHKFGMSSVANSSDETLKFKHELLLSMWLNNISSVLETAKKLRIDWTNVNASDTEKDLHTVPQSTPRPPLEFTGAKITCDDGKEKFVITIDAIYFIDNRYKILGSVSLSGI